MNEQEYLDALARIEFLMRRDPEQDSPEGAELNALIDLVMEYEDEHFPLPFSKPSQ